MEISGSDAMNAPVAKRVVQFPTERTVHPARGGATLTDVIAGRMRGWVCRILNKVGIPGAIQNTEIYDHATGQKITVTVGASVRLTVNGRDFYFDRITGQSVGTGSSFD